MSRNFFDFHEQVTRAKRGDAEPARGGNGPEPLSVGQLTQQIDRALRVGLPASVAVKGEVSNYKHHGASGHCYFTLKDPEACIDCVMFKNDFARLKFKPDDGLELVATGRVGVYPQRGRYQLYVTNLTPVGQGALELAFQQLKRKLEAEGLFAPERKRPLPPYPTRVALVTSKETAALQDMLKVLRHFKWVKVSLYHVSVQGDGSAEQIAAAIHTINANREQLGVDVILLARGGGSLEDLWEFNEEIVARAIAASSVPVATGIGHEVDVSIADLVADYHAHTPTEAAQVVVAQWRRAREAIAADAQRLRVGLRNAVTSARQRLAHIECHEFIRRPLERVDRLRQVVDDQERAMLLAATQSMRVWDRRLEELARRLERHRPVDVVARLRAELQEKREALYRAVRVRVQAEKDRVDELHAGLREHHPRHSIQLMRQRLDAGHAGLAKAERSLHRRQSERVEALNAQLQAVGPEQVLKRGYTITTLKKNGAVLRSAEQLKEGERLVTRFADGKVESVVEDSVQMRLFE